jgi:hypothetical protein
MHHLQVGFNGICFKMNRFAQRVTISLIILFCFWFFGGIFRYSNPLSDLKVQDQKADMQSLFKDTTYNPQWDDFAIALKTGSDVALQRVPIQLLTFLSDVKNKIIIGDGPNVKIGSYKMIDVYTNLYNDSKPSIKKSKFKLAVFINRI